MSYTLQTKLPSIDYENTSTTVEVKEGNKTAPDLTVLVHNAIIKGTVTNNSGQAVQDAVLSLSGIDSVLYTTKPGCISNAIFIP